MPVEQGAGMDEQPLARCRQPHSGTRSLKQCLADLIFKPLHLRAERRLCATDLHRGNADRACPGNDDEVLQKREIKHQDIRVFNIGLE